MLALYVPPVPKFDNTPLLAVSKVTVSVSICPTSGSVIVNAVKGCKLALSLTSCPDNAPAKTGTSFIEVDMTVVA